MAGPLRGQPPSSLRHPLPWPSWLPWGGWGVEDSRPPLPAPWPWPRRRPLHSPMSVELFPPEREHRTVVAPRGGVTGASPLRPHTVYSGAPSSPPEEWRPGSSPRSLPLVVLRLGRARRAETRPPCAVCLLCRCWRGSVVCQDCSRSQAAAQAGPLAVCSWGGETAWSGFKGVAGWPSPLPALSAALSLASPAI